jgi:MFS family permease
LTAGEYGLVVSAFALAKMTGNIPSAVLVERHGRKVSVDWLSRIFVII